MKYYIVDRRSTAMFNVSTANMCYFGGGVFAGVAVTLSVDAFLGRTRSNAKHLKKELEAAEAEFVKLKDMDMAASTENPATILPLLKMARDLSSRKWADGACRGAVEDYIRNVSVLAAHYQKSFLLSREDYERAVRGVVAASKALRTEDFKKK